MYKLENKIAIGCLVQFYEIEIIKDYLLSVKKSLDGIENSSDVIIDICFNIISDIKFVSVITNKFSGRSNGISVWFFSGDFLYKI